MYFNTGTELGVKPVAYLEPDPLSGPVPATTTPTRACLRIGQSCFFMALQSRHHVTGGMCGSAGAKHLVTVALGEQYAQCEQPAPRLPLYHQPESEVRLPLLSAMLWLAQQ